MKKMKSKATSKFNNQNYNSISSISESQKINELINSNEEQLDDKGQVYVDSNVSKFNYLVLFYLIKKKFIKKI